MEDSEFSVSEPLIVTGEAMSAKQVLQAILNTKRILIKHLEEKGLHMGDGPHLCAPPEVWDARQAAIDAGDYKRAAEIEMIIYAANGY